MLLSFAALFLCPTWSPTIFQSSFVWFFLNPHSLNFFSYCAFLESMRSAIRNFRRESSIQVYLRCLESMFLIHFVNDTVRTFKFMPVCDVQTAYGVLESAPALRINP